MVDTDLGGDDLVALAFLLRHPPVRVDAVTIAATGLVGCDPGVDLVADLFAALGEDPVPVACGRAEAGPRGSRVPGGLAELAREPAPACPRRHDARPASSEPAPELIAELARTVDGLVVVALGPLTNLADLAPALAGRRTPGWPGSTRWAARSTARWSTASPSGTPPPTPRRSPPCSPAGSR